MQDETSRERHNMKPREMAAKIAESCADEAEYEEMRPVKLQPFECKGMEERCCDCETHIEEDEVRFQYVFIRVSAKLFDNERSLDNGDMAVVSFCKQCFSRRSVATSL